MNYIIIAFLFILTSCSLPSKSLNSSRMRYENVFNLKLAQTSEEEVLKLFGFPNERSDKEHFFTLNYNDPKTDFQRLSLNFSKESKKLFSILWIPHPGDPEIFLQGAHARFKDIIFKEVKEENMNPHVILDVVTYIDELSGFSFRFDKGRQTVEAIVQFDVNSRIPASPKKRKEIKVTIGDNLESTQ